MIDLTNTYWNILSSNNSHRFKLTNEKRLRFVDHMYFLLIDLKDGCECGSTGGTYESDSNGILLTFEDNPEPVALTYMKTPAANQMKLKQGDYGDFVLERLN